MVIFEAENPVLNLYKLKDNEKLYWETWENNDGTHTIHWGELGTVGESISLDPSVVTDFMDVIQNQIDEFVSDGYGPIDQEEYIPLLIEYEVKGMGNVDDIEKRHRLENRMNETLGWTGLGACDGGSIGSGTMEVCNFVVDFELAKRIIESDLKNTEFSNYTRIYAEDA